MVQYITKSKYNTIEIWTNTNHTNNENVPRKNSQKNADTKIEDSNLYIAELVENILKCCIPGKLYMPTFSGGLDSYYVNIWAM